MCGIAGIYLPEESVDRERLVAMARALHHRGPDASGIFCEGPIGLAHTRLKVVDLSERAAQPMRSASGRLHLTYNGEIYNHRRIRSWLEGRGARLRSSSDTEVLLEGWAEEGDRIFDRLEGMFAFGIWDSFKEELILARDRAGEKPLYYLPLPRGGIAFASEIKALRALEPVLACDPARIPEYLLHGYVPHPATLYQRVRCLEPGHFIRFGRTREIRPEPYWSPKFAATLQPVSYEGAKEQLRHEMRRIVAERLEADVPVGAFLSGGLDSATVVGVATKDLGREVHTYSIGFDDPSIDESKDAKASAQHLGAIHEEFIVSDADVPTIDQLVEHYDEPFADVSAIPTYLVSRMARSRVTVALTGDGGDELFGGYPRFVGGVIAERLPRVLGGLIAATGERLSPHLPAALRSRAERASRLARAIERPLDARMLHWISVYTPDELVRVLRSDHREGARRASAFSERIFAGSEGETPLSRMLDHNFRSYLACDLLPKVDRCSMAVALETRCPFLDSKLISLVGAMPDEFKVAGLERKRILRDTFSDLFAHGLLQRPKRGFAAPISRWLKGLFWREFEQAVRPQSALIKEYVDHGEVERRFFSPNVSWSLIRAMQAWSLWTLEVWLRKS
jgi:asparagine synthase (glutamine-hydrolysing)